MSSVSPARRLTINALMAALLAASAVIAIPVGAVPVTLQVLVVVLIALVLEPRQAAVAILTYVLAGALGLPVFSGMRGGLGVLTGPTGGYLVGFLAGGTAGAWVRMRLERALRSRAVTDVATAATVIVVAYAFGWLQLAAVTSMGGAAAFTAGVAPFVAPDALKAAGAVALAPLVRRAVGR